MRMNIKTANGFTGIKPVFCEVTGKQIAWQTMVTENQWKQGVTPAYISFEVVSNLGIVKKEKDLLSMETF
jgi:hypothetical protein